MLRTGKASALRREAPPVAEDGAITVRSAISAPPPFRRLHCSGQKQPNSLVKPQWSDTPALDFVACCLGCPVTVSRPSFHYVPSAGSQRNWHRAGATTPGNATRRKCCWLCGGVGMREHLRLRCSQAARLCLRFASGTFTQHILCVTLRSFIPGAQGTPRPCAGSK